MTTTLTFEQMKEIEQIKHDNHMKELEYVRETSKIQHENVLTQQRIRTAEIRKNLLRKQSFMEAQNEKHY